MMQMVNRILKILGGVSLYVTYYLPVNWSPGGKGESTLGPGRVVSHQPLTHFACRQVIIIHYLILANAIQALKSTVVQPLKVGAEGDNDSRGIRFQIKQVVAWNNKFTHGL